MDTESAGNLAYGLSFFQKPLGKVLLFNIHFLRASEANTTFLGIDATGSSALPDQVAFELSYPSENGHNGVASGNGYLSTVRK
jgi:hypothetical protein